MLTGLLALIVAAFFFGAATYVSLAEQPARLRLEDGALVHEWQVAYRRGFALQAPLAVLGFVLGTVAWWENGAWPWLLGALLLIANLPYTLIVMLGTNHRIEAIAPAAANGEGRALVERWGRLHAARSALGAGATALFLAAAMR